MQVLLNLCDVQLLTGLGILFSSFVSQSCYVSAYHWQIICYLAWFSATTHAACLPALRTYLYEHPAERNCRLLFMAIFLAGLITALVPTSYFNWKWSNEYYYFEGTASILSSNVRCLFKRGTAQELWDRRACEGPVGLYDHLRQPAADGYLCNTVSVTPDFPSDFATGLSITSTTSHRILILSLIILILGFVTRTLKMFRVTTEAARHTVRQKLGYWAISFLQVITTGCEKFGTTPLRRIILKILRSLDLGISAYLVAKIYSDVISSE